MRSTVQGRIWGDPTHPPGWKIDLAYSKIRILLVGPPKAQRKGCKRNLKHFFVRRGVKIGIIFSWPTPPRLRGGANRLIEIFRLEGVKIWAPLYSYCSGGVVQLDFQFYLKVVPPPLESSGSAPAVCVFKNLQSIGFLTTFSYHGPIICLCRDLWSHFLPLFCLVHPN